MMAELIQQLQELGLSEKQAETFLLVYTYGPKPASSIAKMIDTERTNTYKTLQVLVRL
ncbi:MAG: hypothetical protein KDC78_07540 [Aequorivita sp.]|nr:hypothetical protein [Aequorivita sp.]